MKSPIYRNSCYFKNRQEFINREYNLMMQAKELEQRKLYYPNLDVEKYLKVKNQCS